MSTNEATKPDELGERIRDAAARLFNSRGYGSATVDDIAAAAGVGVGSLYRRWSDKPALANDVFERVITALTQLLATPSLGDAPEEHFLTLTDRVWQFALEHPNEFVFVEGHSHEAFLSDENRARKDALGQVAGRQLTEMGISAPLELAFSMITGTVVHAIRTGVTIDTADAARRTWRALND
jgi:AcrR family transcriptional regulator